MPASLAGGRRGDWMIAAWLAAALLVSAFAWPAATAAQATLPPACRTDCAAPFGTVLGTAPGGVPAYSNCSAKCFVPAPNRAGGTYTGIRWQCVEFARRWLLENRGVVYGDVDTAADLWGKVDTVTRVADARQFRLRAYVNGSAEPPRPGDLLVYASEYLGTGHVAVVTEVDRDAGTVAVAEQNFRNEPWPADYARRIALVQRDGAYWLLDAYLLGWKRVVND